MKQILFSDSAASASATYFASLQGTAEGTSELQAITVMPISGVFTNFNVRLLVAPGAGKSRAFDILVNSAPQMSVTISETDLTGSNVGPLSVSAGDTVCIRLVPTGSPTGTTAYYTLEFNSTANNESIILGSSNSMSSAAVSYHQLMGILKTTSVATESNMWQVMPTSGTIKNFYVHTDTGWGIGADAYDVTISKNGTPTDLTVNLTSAAPTANDTVHTVTVAAGDTISVKTTPLNTPFNSPRTGWGVLFVADTPGESVILGQDDAVMNTAAVRWDHFCPGGIAFTGYNAFESSVLAPAPEGATLKNLYVQLDGSPFANDTAADWYKFDVRLDSGNTGITCTVADNGTGNTKANDTTNSVVVTTNQMISLQITPNSSPTARRATWGLVQYNAESNYPTGAIPTFIWPL